MAITPPKINMEPKNWWFVDVSPFPRGYFPGSMLVFGGVGALSLEIIRKVTVFQICNV